MKKSLVIYFSRAGENYGVGTLLKGNTEVVAEYIQELTGADLFKVEPEEPYPEEYKACCARAREEKDQNARPLLKTYLEDISSYEVIYIGGPIYYGTYPMPLFTCLERLDFEGKIIRPFTTHEGSGLGSVVFDLKKILRGSIIEAGLALQGSMVSLQKEKVANWVKLKS